MQKNEPMCYELVLGRYANLPPRTVMATTPAKAKYSLFMDLDDIYEDFQTFLRDVRSCRRIGHVGAIAPSDDFDRVCASRGIGFARVGMKVTLGDGRTGVIVGVNSSANLDVWLDATETTANCHPTSNITYYDTDDSVLAKYQ